MFDAYVGHKEACRVLRRTATLLAGSATCPVQMFRVKQNLYATQFHPELDRPGIITRVHVYQDAGYFPPHELERARRAAQRHRASPRLRGSSPTSPPGTAEAPPAPLLP